jgi:hypothetical protein
LAPLLAGAADTVIQRRAGCPCGGACPRCSSTVASGPGAPVQRKPAISVPGDACEREADSVADAVMRMPAPVQRACTTIQTMRAPSTRADAQADVGHAVSESARGGAPLSEDVRGYFEPRFGRDFSRVRVHADGGAARSARALQARAYTFGRHIVFGAGEYAPATVAGKRLLAHELTHIVQQGQSATQVAGAEPSTVDGNRSIRPHAGQLQRQAAPDEGEAAQAAPQRICGPDITAPLSALLGTVEPWFRGLSGFEQDRSCMGIGPGGFLAGVNPIMAWDTRELFLPNTGWLDSYFRSNSCGSPRDSRCDTDPQRHTCEAPGTCGNSVVVGGQCMLAGTANYALFGEMCRVCHHYTGRWNRWDMRAIIHAWKVLDGDDPTPPKEVATSAYDRTFPSVPAAANRSSCTGRCALSHGSSFDFIWEPYRPR